MADITSQSEAQGLPSKLETPADLLPDQHTTTNVAASMANAQAPSSTTTIGSVKDSMPISLEPSSHVDPTASDQTSRVPESRPDLQEREPHVNGTAVVTNPGPVAAEAELPEQNNPSAVLTGLPSNSGTVIEPSHEAIAPSPTVEPVVSDMRTEPHNDGLSSRAVELIEERKHAEDNNADLPSMLTTTEATTLPPPHAAPIVATQEQAPSPPPAPEPAKADLRTEATTESVPEPTPQPAAVPVSLPVSEPEPEDAPVPDSESEPAPAPAPAPATQPAAPPSLPPASTEEPAAPAPTPVVPAVVSTQDVQMEDAPTVKQAREREEDDAQEPAAKRARTEDAPPTTAEQSEFKIPETPAASTVEVSTGGASTGHIDSEDAVTVPRLGHMKKVISNLKKSNASQHFRVPVDYVALNIPTYPAIVKTPMDLSIIDLKLKNNQYATVQEFQADFNLIVDNCVAFNGPEHGVTQQAHKMQSSFNNQMQNLPPVSAIEPTKAEKKAMKLKTEPLRTAPPRRPSVTTPATATPKTAVPTTPSFAPGPDGMPLIRRDSSLQTDRPKRAIVPPKRNSDFAGVRPKKKKYELQLRFCQEVLKEIASPKHWQLNQYFTHPVDPVALNIPTYFQIIKKPMDLGTVQTKLDNNQYEKAKDFEEDVRLIFKNCYKFNPEGDYVNQLGRQLEELFDRKWAQKDDWIAAREPQSTPESDGEEDEEDEESEEEGEESEEERNQKLQALQAQIEAMRKQMGELTQSKSSKKKKSTPPTAATKKGKSKPKKEKAGATFPGLSKPAAKESKKKSAKSTKQEKDRYVTFAEKQYISNGIGALPEKPMQEALRIIQSSVPQMANGDSGEVELDIEEVPNWALLKLLNLVRKYAGPPPEEPEAKVEAEYAAAAPSGKKKNKPMKKWEQEAQIEELKGKLGAYADGVSPTAIPTVEGGDSSDESADSEESEEE